MFSFVQIQQKLDSSVIILSFNRNKEYFLLIELPDFTAFAKNLAIEEQVCQTFLQSESHAALGNHQTCESQETLPPNSVWNIKAGILFSQVDVTWQVKPKTISFIGEKLTIL